ncbi:MAG TPA: sialidase family protein [Streptosporangiaceae bacterium]|nr:sialidase family protein [Streptosporangiaceae bacterium]
MPSLAPGAAVLAVSGLLFTHPALTRVSTDPFTNTVSQHATEVEPDTYAFGKTIVGAFQVGRNFAGGAADLGWATSSNGGATWRAGLLPGLTTHLGGGKFPAVSDPSVVFDAKHKTWLISGLLVNTRPADAGISVSRSADAVHWSKPVMAFGGGASKGSWDKDWITCDNHAASPHYGNCYLQADDTSAAGAMVMSVSRDGGATWSAQKMPAGHPHGLGGQPLAQPSGKVIVPFLSDIDGIGVFSSANGGLTWSKETKIATFSHHNAGGDLRDGEGLPSAAVDASGRVYVVWADCRFRTRCSANDLVLSTSSNGTTWSKVARIPIDPTTSGVDHVLPGIGVAGSGNTARIGLYYYFLPKASCKGAACRLEVGYLSSANAGRTWSTPTVVAGPMKFTQLANTNQGRMVGDYISCSISNGRAFSVFAVGKPAVAGHAFNEAMYTAGGLPMKGGSHRAVSGPIRPGRPAKSELSATFGRE